MARSAARPDESKDQTSDRFNEADSAGTGSINSVYAVYAGIPVGACDGHDGALQLPRVMAGAVAKHPKY